MHASDAVIKAIADFEGGQGPDGLFRWYWDQFGKVWTCCYGHTSPGDGYPVHGKDNGPWTRSQAESILRTDIAHSYEPAIRELGIQFSQNQFDALVSFTYNVGVGTLETSHTIGADLHARNFKKVADDFLLYDKAADGQQLDGLLRRRKWERALWLKHANPKPGPHPYKGPVKPGDSGARVVLVQAALVRRGFKLTVDGVFGPGTVKAVLAFKKRHGFPADGIIGTKTWKALAP